MNFASLPPISYSSSLPASTLAVLHYFHCSRSSLTPSTLFDVLTLRNDHRLFVQFATVPRLLLMYLLEFLYTGDIVLDRGEENKSLSGADEAEIEKEMEKEKQREREKMKQRTQIGRAEEFGGDLSSDDDPEDGNYSASSTAPNSPLHRSAAFSDEEPFSPTFAPTTTNNNQNVSRNSSSGNNAATAAAAAAVLSPATKAQKARVLKEQVEKRKAKRETEKQTARIQNLFQLLNKKNRSGVTANEIRDVLNGKQMKSERQKKKEINGTPRTAGRTRASSATGPNVTFSPRSPTSPRTITSPHETISPRAIASPTVPRVARLSLDDEEEDRIGLSPPPSFAISSISPKGATSPSSSHPTCLPIAPGLESIFTRPLPSNHGRTASSFSFVPRYSGRSSSSNQDFLSGASCGGCSGSGGGCSPVPSPMGRMRRGSWSGAGYSSLDPSRWLVSSSSSFPHSPLTLSLARLLYPLSRSRYGYQLPALSSILERYLKTDLNLATSFSLYEFALENEAEELIHVCHDWFSKHLIWYQYGDWKNGQKFRDKMTLEKQDPQRLNEYLKRKIWVGNDAEKQDRKNESSYIDVGRNDGGMNIDEKKGEMEIKPEVKEETEVKSPDLTSFPCSSAPFSSILSRIRSVPYHLESTDSSLAACPSCPSLFFLSGGYSSKTNLSSESLLLFHYPSSTFSLLPCAGEPGALPLTLCFHTMNWVGRELFVFGGEAESKLGNDLWMMETERMKWRKVGKGGRRTLEREKEKERRRNPNLLLEDPTPAIPTDSSADSDLSRSITSPPTPRKRHSSTSIGTSLFVFGGRDRSHVFSDLHVFDTRSLTWSTPATLGTPPVPRYAHTAIYVEPKYITPPRTPRQEGENEGKRGLLVIVGGHSSSGPLNDVHVLDLETMTWDRKIANQGSAMNPASWMEPQPFPIPRFAHTASFIQLTVDPSSSTPISTPALATPPRPYIAVFGGVSSTFHGKQKYKYKYNPHSRSNIHINIHTFTQTELIQFIE